MIKLLCRSCSVVNTKEELRPSGKIKGLSLLSSNRIKTCKNCKGKIFMEVSDEYN